MTEKELRNKVVQTADAWLGCKEADGSHKKIIDLYNGNKPLPRGYAVKYTDAWCSTFASAVAIKADMADIIPLECGCEKHIEKFKAMQCWQENDAYTPAPGDYIFYDWDDNGVGDCTGSADHVGIVVNVSGNSMKVIEGNKSDAVGYRTMQVNGKYIRGYGVPDYAGKAAKSSAAAGVATAEAAAAAEKLAKLGVINSPEYWVQAVASGGIKYLDQLLISAAEKIKKAGTRTATPEQGIANLLAAGVIHAPEYWLANYKAVPNLGALLCALGAAVE